MIGSTERLETGQSIKSDRKLSLSRRQLMPGALLAILAAAGSGVMLSWSADLMVTVHLATGIAGFVPIAVFLAGHWWQRRHRVTRHPNARYGYVALASLILLLLSGLALLPWTNVRLFWMVHTGAAILLLLDLALHMIWRLRRRLWRKPETLLQGWPIIFAITAISVIATLQINTRQPTESEDIERVAIAHNTLDGGQLATGDECQVCHSDIASQWQLSAHGNAVVDPYYQALASMFIQEQGVEAVRFCAGCHNPVGLMQGEIDDNAQVAAGESEHAYEARNLGAELAISQRAAEGVTCVACHQVDAAGSTPGNGSLAIASENDLPDGTKARLALKIAPDRHQASMSMSTMSTYQDSAVCGSCHNLTLPSGLVLEPTFDEWLSSLYPTQETSCQDCHMPAVQGRRVDSALNGTVASHGGLPGAPSSLPDLSGNTDLLRQAATLDHDWSEDEEGYLQLNIWVTNSGAGHYLPTGADDLRQLWLAAKIKNDRGEVVWETGQPDSGGRLPPDTVLFRKILGDAYDRPIELHRIWAATQVLEDTRLAPMERRQITYDLQGVDAAGGPYLLEVRLLYRDVSPDFAEFALDRPVTNLPIFEVAAVNASLQGTAATALTNIRPVPTH